MAKATKVKQKKAATKAVAITEKERSLVEQYCDNYDVTDPRQALFLQLYYDNKSPTWCNAKQSALAAGFEMNYANQITYKQPQWWIDFVRQTDIASLIEKHVSEVLNFPSVTQVMGASGPITTTETIRVEKTYKNGKTRMVNKKIKVPVYAPDVKMIKEKTAVIKIAAPAYDPDKYGKKQAGNNFFFDMRQVRERYNSWNTNSL